MVPVLLGRHLVAGLELTRGAVVLEAQPSWFLYDMGGGGQENNQYQFFNFETYLSQVSFFVAKMACSIP